MNTWLVRNKSKGQKELHCSSFWSLDLLFLSIKGRLEITRLMDILGGIHTERLLIIFSFAAIYVIACTLFGSWSVRRTKDTSSFMNAKKQLSPLLIGFLLMSEVIGAASTLGTAQAAFSKGISASWNVLSLSLGYFLYSKFMAAKYQSLGVYTLSGALAVRYGKTVRMLVSLTMIYALIILTVATVVGGATTLATLLNISMPTAVIFIGIATTITVTLGGIRGVGHANIVHTAAKYIGLIVIAVVAWQMLQTKPGAMAAFHQLPNFYFSPLGMGTSTLIAWTIANVGTLFATQYVMQCIGSLSSPQDARTASLLASVTILPIGLLAAFIGIAAKVLFPDINSLQALPIFLNSMDPWLAGIAVTGITAATFVTILVCQLGITALVMSDFYTPWFKPDEKKSINATRIVSIIAGLVPIPFAIYAPGILKTVFFARSLRTSLAAFAIMMFYLPGFGSKKGAAVGLVCSVVLVTVWMALGDPWGIDNIYIAAITPPIIMGIDQVFFKNKAQVGSTQAKRA
jgi:SSS family solute:Na+ symporter